MSFIGVSVRRLQSDVFEGVPICHDIPRDSRSRDIFLSPTEAEEESQLELKHHWDKETRDDNNRDKSEDPVGADLLVAQVEARMQCIHLLLPQAKYSGLVDVEKDLGEGDEFNFVEALEKIKQRERRKVDKSPEQLHEEFRTKVKQSPGSWHSTKIDKTIQIIKGRLEEKEQLPAAEQGKILVFCSFISGLDVLALGLEEHDIPYCRYDGRTSLTNRKVALKTFKTKPTSDVMLLTAAGGEGLNLDEATTVIMLNPFWNPQQWKQAVMRAIRATQTKPVLVYTLYLESSIEGRVLEVAEDKSTKSKRVIEPHENIRTWKSHLLKMGKWNERAFKSCVSHHILSSDGREHEARTCSLTLIRSSRDLRLRMRTWSGHMILHRNV